MNKKDDNQIKKISSISLLSVLLLPFLIFFCIFKILFTVNVGNPVMITVKVGTVVGKNYSVARVLPLLFSFLIEYLIL